MKSSAWKRLVSGRKNEIRKATRFRPALEVLEARLAPTVNVLGSRNDLGVTGQNLNETILTPANVNPNSFGNLFTLPTDGTVYAQPLYMSGLAIPGQGTHNVVFIATEHDSVYAYDADQGGAPLWQDSFINPGAGVTTVPSTDLNTGAITPEIGITSTPVIDPATGTMYVVVLTKEVSGGNTSYVQRLHALDVTTGAEKFGGPMVIQGSVPGTGLGSVGGVLTFDPRIQLQRPGLQLLNHTVYVAWGSYDDQYYYHGWVMGFDAGSLQRTAIWNDTPNGWGGGIWQAGGGISADSQGNIYVTIGNGGFDVNTGGVDYGESLVKLSTAGGGLTVADYFTPFNLNALNNSDLDFGSGAAMLLPTQPGAHPQLLSAAGKEGRIYLIDQTNLGQFNPNGDNVVGELLAPFPYIGNFSTPAYFNGALYYHMSSGYLSAYQLNNGQLPSGPTSQGSVQFNFPGAAPSISANGTSNGIVWEWQFANPGVLYAYDASNLNNLLYASNQAGQRDLAGRGVKFAVPTIANGHVYVGTQSSVAVFGLFPPASAPPAAAPSNLSSVAASSSSVTLTWTNNATNQIEVNIERSTDDVNFAQVNLVAGAATSYTDTGLTPLTTYYYRVRATNTAGSTGYSDVVSASTPAAPPSDPTLVGYWTFDEGSGTVAGDSSGNGDNGTIIGEVTWIAGQVGPSALSFHGIGNQNPHVDVPDNPVLRFTATQSFTVGAWVDPYALENQWQGIVAKSRDISPLYGIWIDPNNNWVMGGPDLPAGGSGNIVGSAVTVGWHYVAAVQDGTAGTRTLYVDGTPVATGTALDANGTGDLWIGGANTGSDPEYFNGAIDDVRIYNVALSQAQIQAIAPALSASYTSSTPTIWAPGATFTYNVTVQNTGTQTWNAGGNNIVRLGVQFGTASDWPHDGWATDQRFFLPNDVPSGASVTMTVTVTAPTTPGSYVLRHRTVKENVAWFNQIQKTAVVVDGTPPTVTTTSPPAGATGVPGSTTVIVNFSEALDPSTVNASTIFLTPLGGGTPVAATVSYAAGSTSVTLTPTAPLVQNANAYTLTIKGGLNGVKDLAENPLAADYTSSFTTVDTTPPTVSGVSPPSGATGVPGTVVITATFSEAVNQSTLTAATVYLTPAGSTIPVAASLSYAPTTNTVSLTPSAPLATDANNYTLTVKSGPAGVTDLAGNPLAADFTSSFTTLDNTPPTVTGVSPVAGATGVPGTVVITATFSEAVNQSTITSSTVYLTPTGSTTPVAASLSYNSTTNTVSLTPSAPLATNANSYTLTVKSGSAGVTDPFGNPLAADFTSSFTTLDNTPPTIVTMSPAPGSTGVLATAVVTATFSEPVNVSTLTSNTVFLTVSGSGTPIAAGISYDAPSRTVTLRPSVPLAGSTQYQVTIKGGSAGVQDLAGNPLSADQVWSFTTVPPYASAFIFQSVPASMVAGQSYAVSVTMQNTGANTWTWANAYKLGSWNPRDNFTWGFNRVYLPTNVSVLSGAQWTFSFTVRAPSTPGSYAFQWRMVRENVTWFGATSTNVNVVVSATGTTTTLALAAPVTSSAPLTSTAPMGGTVPLSATGSSHDTEVGLPAEMLAALAATPSKAAAPKTPPAAPPTRRLAPQDLADEFFAQS
jgi:hypothetical protein